MPPACTFRAAAPDDAEPIAAAVGRGFEGYREFAPDGWEPPDFAFEVELVAITLRSPETWCLIAEYENELAGHVMFTPAAASRSPTDEPGLAHLRGLFVEPNWWGSGLASELHARALAAAAERGWHTMRLFTPAGQRRARRFYEREGWRAIGAEFELANGLPALEYRRSLA